MSILDRDWHAVGGASQSAIEPLRKADPRQLPASYLALLRTTNGGEPGHEIDAIDASLVPPNNCRSCCSAVTSRLMPFPEVAHHSPAYLKCPTVEIARHESRELWWRERRWISHTCQPAASSAGVVSGQFRTGLFV
jgi:hypothetical protein